MASPVSFRLPLNTSTFALYLKHVTMNESINLRKLIKALRQETRANSISPDTIGSLMQKILDSRPELLPIHITCIAQDDTLFVPGAKELVAAGYVPYVFRYSTMQRRRIDPVTKKKERLRPEKGWHVLFGAGKAEVRNDDSFLFHKFYKNKMTESFDTTSHGLIDAIKLEYSDDYKFEKLKVTYGKRVYDCTNGRRFKFAVGFAPWQKTKFDFNKLVTNLAEFQVYVAYDKEDDFMITRFSL